MTRSLSLCLLAILCLLLSCGHHGGDIQYQALDEEWDRAEKVTFTIAPPEEKGTYDVALLLRTTNRYPFKEVAITVTTTVRPSQQQRRDTLLCALYGDDGTPTGSGIHRYQHSFPLYSIALSPADTLVVDVQHNMQLPELPGISDVGLALSPSQ